MVFMSANEQHGAPVAQPLRPGLMMMCKRIHMVLIVAATALVGCSGGPNMRKQKYFESGNQYFDRGKYSEAAIQYRNAIQIDNSFIEAHYQLAQSYLRQGIWTEAYRELIRTTDLQPDNLKARTDLGRLFQSMKRFKEAQGQAKEVLIRDSNNVEAHILLANADAGLKELEESLREMQTAIRLAPDQPRVYVNKIGRAHV